jgi:hypothetical protein
MDNVLQIIMLPSLWIREYYQVFAELDSPAVSAVRRAIVGVKQRWSVIGWLNNNLLLLRHVNTLVPADFAPTLGPRGGLRPVLLMCNRQGRPVPQQ